jgi:hypothetical protein
MIDGDFSSRIRSFCIMEEDKTHESPISKETSQKYFNVLNCIFLIFHIFLFRTQHFFHCIVFSGTGKNAFDKISSVYQY